MSLPPQRQPRGRGCPPSQPDFVSRASSASLSWHPSQASSIRSPGKRPSRGDLVERSNVSRDASQVECPPAVEVSPSSSYPAATLFHGSVGALSDAGAAAGGKSPLERPARHVLASRTPDCSRSPLSGAPQRKACACACALGCWPVAGGATGVGAEARAADATAGTQDAGRSSGESPDNEGRGVGRLAARAPGDRLDAPQGPSVQEGDKGWLPVLPPSEAFATSSFPRADAGVSPRGAAAQERRDASRAAVSLRPQATSRTSGRPHPTQSRPGRRRPGSRQLASSPGSSERWRAVAAETVWGPPDGGLAPGAARAGLASPAADEAVCGALPRLRTPSDSCCLVAQGDSCLLPATTPLFSVAVSVCAAPPPDARDEAQAGVSSERRAAPAAGWAALRHPLRSAQEERERTAARVREEQRQVLLEIERRRRAAKQRGEPDGDRPPPDLACKLCGVDGEGNLLHPGCVDMAAFLASLGGLYDLDFNHDEEQSTQKELKELQAKLQRLLVKMGRSTGRGEGGGAASQKEPPRVPETVFQNVLEKEMRSFQDLVIDEHKEKKKLFKQLAGGCRRHVEAVEKKKQMKAEEEERRLRAVAKSTCGPVEIFWQRIERLVWEREKRQLQRQLHEKKKQRLDRLVNEAMQQCRRLAQGLRKPRPSGGANGQSEREAGRRATSNPSSRRLSSVSEDEASASRKQSAEPSLRRRKGKRGGKAEGEARGDRRPSAEDEAGPEGDEEGEWTAKLAADQEEEDECLEAEMESEENEQEDAAAELRGLQDEADMPVEELLKRVYGVEGGRSQLESDRLKEERERVHAEETEEGADAEADDRQAEGSGEEDGGVDEEGRWSGFNSAGDQEEEDERLEAEMQREEEEEDDAEAELRGLQDEADMPVEELLKKIYGVEGGQAQLASDRRREAREKAQRAAEADEERDEATDEEDEQEEVAAEADSEAEEEEEGEARERPPEKGAEKANDGRSQGGDDTRGEAAGADEDENGEFSVDGGAFGKQAEEDDELDAAMDSEEEEPEEDELKALQEDAELPIEELIRRFGPPSSGRRRSGESEDEQEEDSASEEEEEEEIVIPVFHRSTRQRAARCREASPNSSPVKSGEPGDAVKRESAQAGGSPAAPGGGDEVKGPEEKFVKRETLAASAAASASSAESSSSLSEANHLSPVGAQSTKAEGGALQRASPVNQKKEESESSSSPGSEAADARAPKREKTRRPSSSPSGKRVESAEASEGERSWGDDSEATDEGKESGRAAAAPPLSSNPAPELVRATLRTYQSEGVDWLFALHEKGLNGILADEMGLGKTLQTIVLLARLAVERGVWGPHLIVVPTSVMLNWEREFFKFCPGFKVLVYFGSAQERAKKRTGWSRPYAFHVCIASYSTVVKDAQIFKRKKWYSLVLDEAQNIKNFHSRRWQTLLTFNTQHRLLLTGTPLQNNLAELWSLMHFLMPTVFQSHEDFKEWFGDPLTAAIEQEQVSEHQQLLEKLHALLRPYLLRRLKKDVEKQMPRKYEHVVRCALTKRQKCLYDEFMQRRQVQQTMAAGSYRGMMNILMQLRKVCNHPDLFEPRPIETPVGGGGVDALAYEVPSLVCLWLYEPWNWSIEERFRRVTLPIVSLIHYEMRLSTLQHGLAQSLSPLLLLVPQSPSARAPCSPFELLSAATPLEACDLLSLPQPIYTRRRSAATASPASPQPASSYSFSADGRTAVGASVRREGAFEGEEAAAPFGAHNAGGLPRGDRTLGASVGGLASHACAPGAEASSALIAAAGEAKDAGRAAGVRAGFLLSTDLPPGEALRPSQACLPLSLSASLSPSSASAPSGAPSAWGPPSSSLDAMCSASSAASGSSVSSLRSSACLSAAEVTRLSSLCAARVAPPSGGSPQPNGVAPGHSSSSSPSVWLPSAGASSAPKPHAQQAFHVSPSRCDAAATKGLALSLRGEGGGGGADERDARRRAGTGPRCSADMQPASPLTPVDAGCQDAEEGGAGSREGPGDRDPARLPPAAARARFTACEGSHGQAPPSPFSEEEGENGDGGARVVSPAFSQDDNAAVFSDAHSGPLRPHAAPLAGVAPPLGASLPSSAVPSFQLNGFAAASSPPDLLLLHSAQEEGAPLPGGSPPSGVSPSAATRDGEAEARAPGPTGLRVSARVAARRSRENGRSSPTEGSLRALEERVADAVASAASGPSLLPAKKRRMLCAAADPRGRRPAGEAEGRVARLVPQLGALVEVPVLQAAASQASPPGRPSAAASGAAAPLAPGVPARTALVLTQPFGCASIPDLDGFLGAHARRRCFGGDRRFLLRNCFPASPVFVAHLMRQQQDSERDCGVLVEDEDLGLGTGERPAKAAAFPSPLKAAAGDPEGGGGLSLAASAGLAHPLGLRGLGGAAGAGAAPPTERGRPRRTIRGIKRAGGLWRRWISGERSDARPGLCLLDETGGESLLDDLRGGSEAEAWKELTAGAQKAELQTACGRPAEPFSAAVDANEDTRRRKADFRRAEEAKGEASRAMFLFHSALSLASPPPFGGCDTRELLRKEISLSATNAMGTVHEPIRSAADLLSRTETLRQITPTPREVFERDQALILRCSVLCNPRVQPGAPRIYLRGPGGIAARENSFAAFAESLELLQESAAELHEAVERQRRIFPPKQTLQDDCGKLIVLAELLTKLRTDGHRCLLFTQFSKMLDVLESWINHQGFTYVRLDGSTKVDQRQRVVTRFNANPRIFLFISSTRAGGIGLNLTGADTVIFYDTDWNPAMDRQAMDRCHRIGQTRDVHVYRLVTEHSIEENIWRKQLQKRLLDQVVVDRGLFTMENTTREGNFRQPAQDEDAAREWFANAETLKDLLASPEESQAKCGFKGDIYADRVLHDSGEDNPDDADPLSHAERGRRRKRDGRETGEFEAAILEVEDGEDVAAMQQTTREEKQAKQELQQDFRGEKPGEEGPVDFNGALERMPALAAYCVRLINENKPPSLLTQIAQLKTQVRAEGDEDEAASEEQRSEVDETPESSGDEPAQWESEIESEEETD
ncbi:SWI2/SNF2 SRCAP/Ino80 [Besnoitia besnoiti]|uniref:SWI2/SNF2 SRCAP/Ino80 n=1 Tax=Besnoitia besnoiti TaxID=94643 RepID=A0A2A9MKH0_BESBE|nr:SWI2/SNF2 SRCAP/Ino80 [Besnoitia besnoiti]PFH36117.1 SWI2/SNF2 SRCAP/Ino80 [Besnoitia besnoiti]